MTSDEPAVTPPVVLRDDIVADLRERIVSGALAPGTRLRERTLAQEFGVSRVPFREAILVLEQQRLVDTAPRIGATVTRLTGKDVAELFELRSALEPLTARLAAGARTDDDLRDLHALHERAVTAAGRSDSVSGSLANAEFHLALLRAAHSDLLWQVASPLDSQIRRVFRLTIDRHEDELCADHEHVLAAVEARDGDLAAFWAARHVEQTRDRSVALFD